MAEEPDYKALAASLERPNEGGDNGGWPWAKTGMRGATVDAMLSNGTTFRLIRGLSAAGKKKFQADQKAEKLKNVESGQYPEAEKKLIMSFTEGGPYEVKNKNPD